ncbi:MAG TPA: VWA domain-containing protein, partial [Candidatus Polarisedimenticolia bacterium]|nr:VWA domain-containing protein [Candidatus Polarisedimenticolia bacterium]
MRQVILTTAGLLACAAAMLHSAAQDEGKTDRPIEGPLVETATSELVLIEVYVSDRKGRPVRDLTIDEFRLMVDRRSKPIASLEYYEIRPMQPDEGTTAETGAPIPAAPGVERGAVPVRRLPRRFILFFDDATSAPMGMGAARIAAERFIDAGLAPDDQVALVTYDNNRKLEVPVDFTTDRDVLRQALRDGVDDKRRMSDFTSTRIARLDEIGRLMSQAGLKPGSQPPQNVEMAARNYALEDSAVMTRVLDAMQMMVQVLAPWPGYKAVVYIGEGIPDNPGGEYGIATPELNLGPQIGELTQGAAATGVTLHSIKSSGLEGGATAEGQGIHSSGAAARLGSSEDRTNALKNLAHGSGGLALTSNDALKSLTEVEEGSRSYYLLGYIPEGPPDGIYHSVTVKISRPKIDVRYRGGFVRLLPEQARERAVQAAHLVPELSPDLGMELSAITGPADLEGRVTDLVLYLPATQVIFLPEGEHFAARLEIGIVGLDAGGRETLRLARRVRIALSPAQIASRSSLGLNFFTRVRLPLEDQEITVVVADRQGTSIGAARLPIAAPEEMTGGVLGLSVYSLAEESMWIEIGGGPAVPADAETDVSITMGPALRNTFSADEPIACGFRL